MPDQANWYIVVGFGARSGVPKHTPQEAWDSYFYIHNAYPAHLRAEWRKATCARLYAATSKSAALQADISEVHGRANRMSQWWRVGDYQP